MSIIYNEEKKFFALQTKNTSYVFSIYEEKPKYTDATQRRTLRSVYWGKKVSRLADFFRNFNWVINGCNDGGKHSHERFASEFVGYGGMFYSEPTLKVEFVNGVRDLFLNYVSHEIIDNVLKITLKDVNYELTVQLIYNVIEDLDIIVRKCIIENGCNETVKLEKAFSATVNLPYADKYYLTSMDSKWTHEYDLHHTEITKTRTILQSLGGVSNSQNYPYFAIDDGTASESHGDIWYGALAWSGNTKITVEKDIMEQVRVTAGISDEDFAWLLNSGESFETPEVVLGFVSDGFNGASTRMQKYVKNSRVESEWKNKATPVIYNGWDCFQFDINEEKLMSIVEKAAKLGSEVFAVDDGWMENRNNTAAGLGDWRIDLNKFPNGFGPLIKKVNDFGMKFGLWVEPEMVSRDSDLFRNHPEWVLGFSSREYEESRQQLVLNLALDDVKDYIISVIDNLLLNNNIEYLKWDMNRYISQASHPFYFEQRMMWVKYVRNLYKIFKHIKDKYPYLLFENCASGGLRADIETLKYSDCMNYSDNNDPVDSLYMREAASLVLPLNYMGGTGHISANNTGFNRRECTLEFKALQGMNGTLGISIDLTSISDEEIEEIAKYVSLAKELRDTIQLGTGYKLRSIYNDNSWCQEYVSQDGNEVLVFIFAPQLKFTYCYPSLKLFGLDKVALYSIDDQYVMSGEGLMNRGLDSKIYGLGNMVAKLIKIRKI